MKIKKFFKIVLILMLLGIVFLLYCYCESYWIKTSNLEIKSSAIPAAFNNKTIVFISDVHHGPYFSVARVKKLVERINAIKPDIILLGGDYVSRDSCYILPFFDELKNLQAPLGIYAVLGNHDHWLSAKQTHELMTRNGIHLCDNKSFWVKAGSDSIKIGGVGDLWEDMQILDSTTQDLRKNDFCILLSHNPDYIEAMNTDLIDLTLSGHTHGGQMTLFGMWSPVLPSRFGQKYKYGLLQTPTMQSYISTGIGTITPPLRFFCRPEIVVINLKSEQE